jgi:hypothetical protein
MAARERLGEEAARAKAVPCQSSARLTPVCGKKAEGAGFEEAGARGMEQERRLLGHGLGRVADLESGAGDRDAD